jgi:hypothetical protein
MIVAVAGENTVRKFMEDLAIPKKLGYEYANRGIIAPKAVIAMGSDTTFSIIK